MFDNLREDAASSYEEKAKFQSVIGTESVYSARPQSKRILGMTSFQRFVISFMLMLAVCVIGVMVLFVTGKVGF